MHTRPAAEPPCFLSILLFVEVRDQKIGAFARKGDGNRAADARIAASNEKKRSRYF
jgi:hypothetical protein